MRKEVQRCEVFCPKSHNLQVPEPKSNAEQWDSYSQEGQSWVIPLYPQGISSLDAHTTCSWLSEAVDSDLQIWPTKAGVFLQQWEETLSTLTLLDGFIIICFEYLHSRREAPLIP